MYPRTEYEMTQEDLNTILDASKPVPAIMLHIGGGPKSPQENANNAWESLGQKMGFDYMTVRPTEKGDRFFTAVPSETETHRQERLKAEGEEKRQSKIKELRNKIELDSELIKLLAE